MANTTSPENQAFVEEVVWCIDQLELGLQRLNPDSRQAAESIKVLKILRSKKAPLVKKRQAMRSALGDYRKKMKDSDKKTLSSMRHSKFVAPVSRSRFLRHSSNIQTHQNIGTELRGLNINSEAASSQGDLPWSPAVDSLGPQTSALDSLNQSAEGRDQFHFVPSDNSFCFSFDVEPEGSCDVTNGVTNGIDKDVPSKNFYKLEKSDNEFSFDFGKS